MRIRPALAAILLIGAASPGPTRADSCPANAAVCYAYDTFGRLAAATYPGSVQVAYTYDNNDNTLIKSVAKPPLEALNRYYSSTAGHWVTVGSVDPSYHLESVLGYLFDNSAPGTHLLYSCVSGATNHFVSASSTCEGQTVLGQTGWILDSAQAGTQELYRCRTSGDHFVSPSATCEGQTVEYPLGYALVSQ